MTGASGAGLRGLPLLVRGAEAGRRGTAGAVIESSRGLSGLGGQVDISRRARMKRHAVSILILLTVRGLGLAVFPEVAMFRSPVLDFLLWAVGGGVIVFVSEVFDLL